MRISKSVMAVSGVVLAGGLIAFTNPKTVHAVTAALVQVTNTASNPAIVQGVGQQAAQIVDINCSDGSCLPVPPTGVDVTARGNYVVPNGQLLVVNTVDLYTGISSHTPCMSPAFVELVLLDSTSSITATRKTWLVPSGIGTAHYVYPSGIVVASGAGLGYIATLPCSTEVDLYGYLTAQ